MATQEEGQQTEQAIQTEPEVQATRTGFGCFFRRVLGREEVKAEPRSSSEEDEGEEEMAQPVCANTPRTPDPNLCRVC